MNNLKLNILSLPRDIQKKIYIWTWKLFWRSYVPITAKIPSWQKRADYVQSQLWMAREKNIHFLHLPFNTLPENKKWIMGCQCSFCIEDTVVPIIEKHCHSLIQYRNPRYFSDNLMPHETSGIWNEKLLHPFIGVTFNGMLGVTSIKYAGKIFDPLCGSYKENIIAFKLRKGIPIHFSTDLDYL